MAKKRELFVCTGNSCRSQMAEGLLRHLAGDRFEAASAGAVPRLHWNFEDPAAATRSPEERWAVFRRVRDNIAKRIREFIEPIDRAWS